VTSFKQQWVAYQTIVIRELKRMMRIWTQTVLPPAITTVLYFLIFGQIIGTRVGAINGFNYIQYIAPGLIMMNMITSAYASAVSAFFNAKFQRNIEEILVAPVSHITIILGYMSGGVVRSLIVGAIVTIIAVFFTHLHVYSFWIILIVGVLASCIFALAGIINAILAKTFDDISIIPTFVLTPLTYLGGVFYSIKMLPSFWQYVSLGNPILYIVDNFRYGFLGITDSHTGVANLLMICFLLILFFIAFILIKKGVGLRE
jgi:ABC-2 type transport system permease protein